MFFDYFEWCAFFVILGGVFFRRAKTRQLNKPDIENTFVYAYFLVNFFTVRKNETGTLYITLLPFSVSQQAIIHM